VIIIVSVVLLAVFRTEQEITASRGVQLPTLVPLNVQTVQIHRFLGVHSGVSIILRAPVKCGCEVAKREKLLLILSVEVIVKMWMWQWDMPPMSV